MGAERGRHVEGNELRIQGKVKGCEKEEGGAEMMGGERS